MLGVASYPPLRPEGVVVRHPLLRLLSAYVDRILRPESYQSRYYVPRVFQNVKVGVKHFIKNVKYKCFQIVSLNAGPIGENGHLDDISSRK